MTDEAPLASKNRRAATVEHRRLAERCARGRIVLIDDDAEIVAAFAALLDFEGYACETYPSALTYLQMRSFNQPQFAGPNCVLCDVKMPEFDGLQLQRRLIELDDTPLLLMSGASGAEEAVSAFRAGAVDFLIKPVDDEMLLAAVARALGLSAERQRFFERRTDLAQRMASLTGRERDVLHWVARGEMNRPIAEKLGIALRTVKLHRQRGMEKLGVGTVADLTRIADEGGL